MQFGLTIPLQRFLHIKTLCYGEPLDTLYCWDLHKILLHGEPSLLAVHCASRFTFVLYAMSAADWDNLDVIAYSGIERSLLEAAMPQEAIRNYLERAGTPQQTKTHGRREVAYLNRAWDDVTALDYTVDTEQQWQPLLNHSVNEIPCRCAAREQKASAFEHLTALLQY